MLDESFEEDVAVIGAEAQPPCTFEWRPTGDSMELCSDWSEFVLGLV